MPGGQVELGETLEEAAIREAKEESGIDVGNLQFCGVYHTHDRCIINTLFRGTCLGGELRGSDETEEAGFFNPKQALKMVTYGNFRERIELCLDPSKQPFYIIAEPRVTATR